jgi:hypothetical protein
MRVGGGLGGVVDGMGVGLVEYLRQEMQNCFTGGGRGGYDIFPLPLFLAHIKGQMFSFQYADVSQYDKHGIISPFMV